MRVTLVYERTECETVYCNSGSVITSYDPWLSRGLSAVFFATVQSSCCHDSRRLCLT